MRTTRQLSITLPNEMADALRERVQSGEYASESEVIRDGLRALWARDQAVEAWLQGEVAASYDAATSPCSHASTACSRAHSARRPSRMTSLSLAYSPDWTRSRSASAISLGSVMLSCRVVRMADSSPQ